VSTQRRHSSSPERTDSRTRQFTTETVSFADRRSPRLPSHRTSFTAPGSRSPFQPGSARYARLISRHVSTRTGLAVLTHSCFPRTTSCSSVHLSRGTEKRRRSDAGGWGFGLFRSLPYRARGLAVPPRSRTRLSPPLNLDTRGDRRRSPGIVITPTFPRRSLLHRSHGRSCRSSVLLSRRTGKKRQRRARRMGGLELLPVSLGFSPSWLEDSPALPRGRAEKRRTGVRCGKQRIETERRRQKEPSIATSKQRTQVQGGRATSVSDEPRGCGARGCCARVVSLPTKPWVSRFCHSTRPLPRLETSTGTPCPI